VKENHKNADATPESMSDIGHIEGLSESAPIEQDRWIALIGSHRSLGPVPPRKGINPFTGKPTEFNAPATSAVVPIGGAAVGSIYWAQDGSPTLFVMGQDVHRDSVAGVAADVAVALGGRFIPETG
jgi:hypothetical protein